ncbi:hypothetical protein AVEN_81708-1 [Araneus ventricosus]|uniref:Uncharacterized protein n=1 Tax=Araneus ventricosus TaxID=182803 RepID=A0A4Y2IBN8_ARAVE|nr:hypothetical protein AVEN_81708-1 [Araneus ventricosus]
MRTLGYMDRENSCLLPMLSIDLEPNEDKEPYVYGLPTLVYQITFHFLGIKFISHQREFVSIFESKGAAEPCKFFFNKLVVEIKESNRNFELDNWFMRVPFILQLTNYGLTANGN